MNRRELLAALTAIIVAPPTPEPEGLERMIRADLDTFYLDNNRPLTEADFTNFIQLAPRHAEVVVFENGRWTRARRPE